MHLDKNFVRCQDAINFASCSSSGEEPLGEGGDKADFGEGADSPLRRCQVCRGILQFETAGEEATPMERGDAAYERSVRQKDMAVGLNKQVGKNMLSVW
jgi:hypothetical protein